MNIEPRWLPTEENLAVLPAGVKQYIHALETNADPAGTVRQNVLLREQLEYLGELVEELQKDADRWAYARQYGVALFNDRTDDGRLQWWRMRDDADIAVDRLAAAMGSEASP